jgi:enoyl-CoA hydratase/carnithine racemase
MISTGYKNFCAGADFGTGHALTYTEHDENHPFTDGAAGNR